MALLARLFAFRMPSLVSSFSAAFLFVFLPLCLILMALLPSRAKKYGLLLLSIGFSWLIGGPLVLWLLFSVALAFGFGLWLESVRKKQEAALKETPKEQKKEVKRRWLKRSRRILALGLFLDLGALIGLKYTPFILENVNRLSQAIGGRALVSLPHILIPLGISFYSMQCAAYLFDVYRGSISADRNPFRLALFMTYFPQIAEGPICRYQQTAQALWNIGPIRFENLTHGLQRILYGMMKKLVVADRLNPFVSAVFTDYASYPGGVAALGALAYTVQLYMDFSGAMDVALGLSQILGVTLPENFRRPFFSRSVSEFWTRWHISLGAWFRDYLFYPLTLSAPLKKLTSAARKRLGNIYGPLCTGAIALFCVWMCNGLWHGAAWSFIFFGFYHFVMIAGGSLIQPLGRKLREALSIREDAGPLRLLQILRTGILVVIGELFFRAEGLRAGFSMLGRMLTHFSFRGLDGAMLGQLGLDMADVGIVLVTMLLILVMGLLQERGLPIRASLQKKPAALRWALLYGLILYIVLFGAYGTGYLPVDPMYANF